jgi:23S rRNA (pseudouridine1915-N3)-methyltransferase
MRLTICAVGRYRQGPEKTLTEDYMTRLDRGGKALSLGPTALIEVEDKKGGGKDAEAALLKRAVPDGDLVCALDERGKTLTSPEFAHKLAHWRDDGVRGVSFLIGGAEGLSPDLRASADFSISFGKMVWPHMLVRVMLAEQLYRASTILAGTPYHKA